MCVPGDLVRDIACIAPREDRGPRADDTFGSLGHAVGIPLKEDAVGCLRDVRNDHGRCSASHGFDAG